MIRKNYFTIFLTISLFLIGTMSAFGQTTAPVTGVVELQKADGTKAPVEGALVEIYNIDTKSSLPTAKTNKKGEFSFAGLPRGGNYALGISAPGARPGVMPGVKAGAAEILVTLAEGDGSRFTPEKVRELVAASAAAGPMTAEQQKKAQADRAKLEAEHAAKKKEIESKTAVIQQALNDGNAAFNSKNYDLAVTKYEEGVAADPEYVGSAPVLLNNKAVALRLRAIGTFNEAVKNPDATARNEGKAKAKKDLADSAEAYGKSWQILKAAAPADITDPTNYEKSKLDALRGAKDTFRIMSATEQVDGAQTELAKTLIAEYIAVETDAVKKAEAQIALADFYQTAQDFDNAIATYKKALELSPDHPDALVGAGLNLMTVGYMNNDTAKFQEALNYLQKFVDVAPDTHKLKKDTMATVENLKREQKITPQKVTTKKKT